MKTTTAAALTLFGAIMSDRAAPPTPPTPATPATVIPRSPVQPPSPTASFLISRTPSPIDLPMAAHSGFQSSSKPARSTVTQSRSSGRTSRPSKGNSGGGYSLYPSTHQSQRPSMDRPSSKAGQRPQPPTATSTSLHVPQYIPEHSQTDASGEPLVEDFQTRHIAAPYTSASLKQPFDLSTLPGIEPNFDDFVALPPLDLSKRGINVPSRTSSAMHATRVSNKSNGANGSTGAASSVPTTPESHHRKSWDSLHSAASTTSSVASTHQLPALQTKGPPDDMDRLDPVIEDDPANFDLLAAPADQVTGVYELEKRGEQVMSKEHLKLIFQDSRLLLNFTGFLNSHRPQSIRVLVYYLDALKAIRAIQYANAIARSLEPLGGHDFTTRATQATVNAEIQAKADEAFEAMVREDLPAYVAFTWIQVVSVSISRRITGTLAPHLREASEGLAEVFCLSDPSRPDNPIVFASEEFARTTQYGMSYSIGRNCRFLQGPTTNKHSVRRLAQACKAGREHSEVFMNYRRDGSPFANLLMIAPLLDSKGITRYFIGAQVDVSGLVKDCTDLEAFAHLVAREENPDLAEMEDQHNQKDEFRSLTEMFNVGELETVRKHGGRMHRDQVDEEADRDSLVSHKPRLLIQDPTEEVLDRSARSSQEAGVLSSAAELRQNGKLQGVYQHYLLIRPHPSLRILFTSPSLRVPGILQSPFMSRIGGSSRVRSELTQAFAEARGVTAKIRWLARADEDGEGDGRSRWIHCTPLLGHTGAVGVWMVVLVDEEGGGVSPADAAKRRFRPAPPVSTVIGGKEYDAHAHVAAQRRDGTSSSLAYNNSPDVNRYAPGRPSGPLRTQSREDTKIKALHVSGHNRSRSALSGGAENTSRPESERSFAIR